MFLLACSGIVVCDGHTLFGWGGGGGGGGGGHIMGAVLVFGMTFCCMNCCGFCMSLLLQLACPITYVPLGLLCGTCTPDPCDLV